MNDKRQNQIFYTVWIFLGIAFYLLLNIGADFDFLAVTIVVVSILLAFLDKRFLLLGWFLAAPYFCQSGKLNSINIAANVSHNLFIPFIFIITLVSAFIDRRKLVFPDSTRWYLIFLAYLFLSVTVIGGASYNAYRLIYFIYTIPFLLFLIIANTRLDAKFFKWMTGLCFFHMAALTLLTIQEFRSGQSIFIQYSPWQAGNLAAGFLGRVAGPFYNPVILGLFTYFLFFIIFTARGKKHVSLLFFCGTVVCMFFIIYTILTRSVWLGLIVCILFLLYKSSKRTALTASIIVFFIGLLIGAYFLMVQDPKLQQRLSANTGTERLMIMYAGVEMFLSHPLFGIGFDQFDKMKDIYFRSLFGLSMNRAPATSHTTFITFLAELGLLGTILLMIFFYKNIKLTVVPQGHTDPWMFWGSASVVIFFVINAILIDMRFFTIAYSLLFATLGIAANLSALSLGNVKKNAADST